MRSRVAAARIVAAWFAVSFITLSTQPALAGPGGIIKAAVASPLGRIGLLLLAIILSPIIAYYAIKTEIQRRRTQRDLAKLAETLPQYRWLDVKDRATGVFRWVWASWSRQKMDEAAQFCTHWYWQNQQMLLDTWAEQGLENVCRMEEIKSITPLFVQHRPENGGEGSRIVVDIRARVVDYMVNKATGQIVQGDEKVGDLDAVWTFVWSDGAWKLNLIEAGAEEWTYLFMPNEIHAGVAEPAGHTV